MGAVSFSDLPFGAGSVGDVLRIIRRTDGSSRSSLARATGLASSTVSLRVDALVRLGLVREEGEETSRGGRRARRIALDPQAGFVAAADFGANHVRVVLSDTSGRPLVDASSEDGSLEPLAPDADVDAAVELLWTGISRLARQQGLTGAHLLGAAVGVPAPLEQPSLRLVTPSFRPSWHDSDLAGAFARVTDRPVLIENDANLVALGEAADLGGNRGDDLLAVKLGTRIGSGIVIGGQLHRGFGGVAGELAHTAVSGDSVVPCTCPVPGCLESVAGGGALVERLRDAGFPVRSTADVVSLGATGDPRATVLIREAGARIGEAIASLVNFLNPRAVVLAGTMSASAPLVAAIKGEVFQRAFPVATERLEVRTTRNDRDAGIIGATTLVLDEVFAPARVNVLAGGAEVAVGLTAR